MYFPILNLKRGADIPNNVFRKPKSRHRGDHHGTFNPVMCGDNIRMIENLSGKMWAVLHVLCKMLFTKVLYLFGALWEADGFILLI